MKPFCRHCMALGDIVMNSFSVLRRPWKDPLEYSGNALESQESVKFSSCSVKALQDIAVNYKELQGTAALQGIARKPFGILNETGYNGSRKKYRVESWIPKEIILRALQGTAGDCRPLQWNYLHS